MQKQHKYLELDIHKMDINQDGVDNFFWPVSYYERENFLNQLIKQYMRIVTTGTCDDYSLPYKFAAKYFINEVLGVFNSDLLNTRFKESALLPRCNKKWRLWPSLFVGSRPNQPAFIKMLVQGPRAKTNTLQRFNVTRKIKRIFSFLKLNSTGLSLGYLKLKPISANVLKHDIIATQRSELIQEHAAEVKKDVIFCRSDRWFKGVSEAELEIALKKPPTIFEEQILASLEKLYIDNGLELKDASRDYLLDILRITPHLISIHYQRLLDMPDKLPVNVWTGSNGNIWDALLRHASLAIHGGEIVGHDHGAALAHVDNPMMAFRELWGCKKFVCINKNQAYEMRQHAKNWKFFEPEQPKMIGLDTQNKFIEFEKFQSVNFKVKSIILLVSLSGGDRVWMGPCSSDTVLVDWYTQVTAHLKGWGYKVILKSHPELPPAPQLLIDMADQYREDPLENMMEEGDLVLFDTLYTTVFRSVLSTNIPMVLIDFYNHPWTDKALSLFTNRASFIQSGFDDNNRAIVNRGLLKKAIEEAPKKRDNREFFEYYYG